MPNRCDNSIEIKTKTNLDKFLVKDKNDKYSLYFNKLIPISSAEHTITLAHNLWWTKWDVYSPDNKFWVEYPLDVTPYPDGTYLIEGSFNTARAPPIPYYEKLLKLLKKWDPNSTLTAMYYEPGVWFIWVWGNWIDECHNTNSIYEIEELDCYAIITDWAVKKIYIIIHRCTDKLNAFINICY